MIARFLILTCLILGFASTAHAADEFGNRFNDQTPPGLADATTVAPQDIEPAAGEDAEADKTPAAEINHAADRDVEEASGDQSNTQNLAEPETSIAPAE